MENKMKSKKLTTKEKTEKFNDFFNELNTEDENNKIKFFNGFINLINYNNNK